MQERTPKEPAHQAPMRQAQPAPQQPIRRSPAMMVGAVDDAAEREADRLADLAMRSLRDPAPATPPREGANRIARATVPGGELDEEIDLDDLEQDGSPAPQTVVPAAPSSPSSIGRVAAAPQPTGVIGPEGGALDDDTAGRIRRATGGGRPLADDVRADMEGAFGRDLGSVRIHTGAGAASLNRSLSARAFATGNDIFFAEGAHDPTSQAGRRLLAHELAHVVQQTGLPATPTRRLVRRKFVPATTSSNAHLRDVNDWNNFKGPKIKSGANVLVNPTAPRVQQKKSSTVNWLPAVNVEPDGFGQAVSNDRRGFIRASRVQTVGTDLNQTLRTKIHDILVETEQFHPMLGGQLAKPAHIDFLYEKALRVDEWNHDASTADDFAPGFTSVNDKIKRIREGAEYLASSVDHWLDWLHPDRKTMVWDLELMESDLHEHGLGVAKVEFRKSLGPNGHKFANDRVVKAMLKPEDKSLEQALLGDEPTSAANKINQIVGLTDPDEMLTTIRMQSSQDHGTLVEVVKGMAAEKLTAGPHATKAVFHETLVFAFLAGIDDLHKENVFWHDGRPYLIDADNVLSRNQMHKQASGDLDQSGFSLFNSNEAAANRNAIKSGDNSTVQSKILDAMLNDQAKRVDIAKVLRKAITGKKGRVVPVASRFWGQQIGYYRSQERYREQNLDASSGEQVMVGRAGRFDASVGAGLIGVCGENTAARFYDQAAEKEQQRADFEAGVIPFYEYEFSTGKVTHNGTHIWDGLTVDQAIGAMLDRFDPSGVSRTSAGL